MSNYDEEPWAAFVREIGLEPFETESQASRVAGFAAAERDRLKTEKAELVAALEESYQAMMEASSVSMPAARAVSAAIHKARAAIAKSNS